MIDDGDYPIIQQMIDTALSTVRVDNDGMVRRGTVTTYDATTRVAVVLVDGDMVTTDIESVVVGDLLPGQRVQVMFHAPHGASVIGIVTTPDAPIDPLVGAILFSFSPLSLTNGALDTLGGLSTFYDPDGMWDGARFNVPSDGAGVYSILVAASQPGFTVPSTRFFTGCTTNSGLILRDPSGTTAESVSSMSSTLVLGGGAWVTPEVFYAHSGSLTWDVQVEFVRLFRTP